MSSLSSLTGKNILHRNLHLLRWGFLESCLNLKKFSLIASSCYSKHDSGISLFIQALDLHRSDFWLRFWNLGFRIFLIKSSFLSRSMKIYTYLMFLRNINEFFRVWYLKFRFGFLMKIPVIFLEILSFFFSISLFLLWSCLSPLDSHSNCKRNWFDDEGSWELLRILMIFDFDLIRFWYGFWCNSDSDDWIDLILWFCLIWFGFDGDSVRWFGSKKKRLGFEGSWMFLRVFFGNLWILILLIRERESETCLLSWHWFYGNNSELAIYIWHVWFWTNEMLPSGPLDLWLGFVIFLTFEDFSAKKES